MSLSTMLSRSPKLPYDDQSSSPLFQLPAEVRQKILRLVFKKDRCINPVVTASTDCSVLGVWGDMDIQEEEHRKEIYKQDACLSGQALRICQRLYGEGGNVLYCENSLSIVVRLREDHRCSAPQVMTLNVFDIQISLPDLANNYVSNLLSYAKQRIYTSATSNNEFGNFKRIPEIYPVLERFRRFTVFVDHSDYDDFFIACRMLHNLLHGKHVTMEVFHVGNNKILHPDHCKILRCASFALRIRDPFESYYASEQLIRVITSQTAAQDMFPAWVDLRDRTERMIYEEHGLGLDIYDEMVRKSKDAAQEYNRDEFEHHKEELLNWVTTWVEEQHRAKVADARAEKESRDKLVDQLRLQDKESEAYNELH
ncbi:hypothetical protein LTS08_002838 [Lithohypha guttulata]|nr:hypothetical protein LTS08_002838 [Lithohypha guttulata]